MVRGRRGSDLVPLFSDVAYLYESLREKQGATPDPFGKQGCSSGLGAGRGLSVLLREAFGLPGRRALRSPDRAPSAPFVLTEPDKENAFHVTKDTSGAGRSDDPPVLPPAPASQACFEEPQPSTSTSELFPSASTSSMEPRAGQAPAPGSGEMGTQAVATWPFDLCCGRDRWATEECSGRVRLRPLGRGSSEQSRPGPESC